MQDIQYSNYAIATYFSYILFPGSSSGVQSVFMERQVWEMLTQWCWSQQEEMVTLNDFSLEIISVKSVWLSKGKKSRLWSCLFGTSDLKTSQKKRIVHLQYLDYLPFCSAYELRTPSPKVKLSSRQCFGRNLSFVCTLVSIRRNYNRDITTREECTTIAHWSWAFILQTVFGAQSLKRKTCK